MVLLGLLLGMAGMDVTSGAQRYTFGVPELYDGINFIAVAMGLFGIAEIMVNLEQPEKDRKTLVRSTRSIGLWRLSRDDFHRAWPASMRGTALGSILGSLPGGGAAISAFSAYTVEKKISKEPDRFGKGAIEGVAGPEAANNAGAQTSFIPMLTLGLPSNPIMALMMGAMIIHGIQPGPRVMTSNPELFWGVIASMWVGNIMLVVLNLPLIGIWIKMLTVKYRLLYPAILVICAIGVYSVSNSNFLVMLMAVFGVLGYVFVKLGCEPAPLLLGMILGPMMEETLRRAMTLSSGDPTVFITRPLSLALLLAAALLLVLVAAPALARRRKEVFAKTESNL
jgi:TctA family transporter